MDVLHLMFICIECESFTKKYNKYIRNINAILAQGHVFNCKRDDRGFDSHNRSIETEICGVFISLVEAKRMGNEIFLMDGSVLTLGFRVASVYPVMYGIQQKQKNRNINK